jgi:hypothetical protein
LTTQTIDTTESDTDRHTPDLYRRLTHTPQTPDCLTLLCVDVVCRQWCGYFAVDLRALWGRGVGRGGHSDHLDRCHCHGGTNKVIPDRKHTAHTHTPSTKTHTKHTRTNTEIENTKETHWCSCIQLDSAPALSNPPLSLLCSIDDGCLSPPAGRLHVRARRLLHQPVKMYIHIYIYIYI